MYYNGNYKNYKIHRLVAKAFIPNPENKPTVNHIDGYKMNNCINNLEWTTYSENSQHALKIGLIKYGEENSNAKLTNEEAVWCRRVHIFGDKEFGTASLAKKFNVDFRTMLDIILGKTYKNVETKVNLKNSLNQGD